MTISKSVGLATLAGLLVLAALAASAAPPPVAVQVSPNVSMAPATVRVVVTVEPDDRNRGLRVEADSNEFFSASEVSLDGKSSSRTQRFEFKNLPPGQYDVRVTLERSDGGSQVASTGYIVS